MNKIGVIYWTGSGNTEIMANEIAAGIKSAGSEVDVFTVDQIDVAAAKGYEMLALGCPSMGAEVLEEAEFEPFFTELEGHLSGKKVALFGSYGWGDGEWMRDWQERVENSGANLFEEGFMINETPEGDDLTTCQAFGKKFSNY